MVPSPLPLLPLSPLCSSDSSPFPSLLFPLPLQGDACHRIVFQEVLTKCLVLEAALRSAMVVGGRPLEPSFEAKLDATQEALCRALDSLHESPLVGQREGEGEKEGEEEGEEEGEREGRGEGRGEGEGDREGRLPATFAFKGQDDFCAIQDDVAAFIAGKGKEEGKEEGKEKEKGKGEREEEGKEEREEEGKGEREEKGKEEGKEEREALRVEAADAKAEASRWRALFLGERTRRRATLAQLHAMRGNIRVLCRVRPSLPSLLHAGASLPSLPSLPSPPSPPLCVSLPLPGIVRLDRRFEGKGKGKGEGEGKGERERERKGKGEGKGEGEGSPSNSHLKLRAPMDFEFSCALGPRSTQADVFAELAPLVSSVADGCNACVFAYGQTGSGKTYTMVSGPLPSPLLSFPLSPPLPSPLPPLPPSLTQVGIGSGLAQRSERTGC